MHFLKASTSAAFPNSSVNVSEPLTSCKAGDGDYKDNFTHHWNALCSGKESSIPVAVHHQDTSSCMGCRTLIQIQFGG